MQAVTAGLQFLQACQQADGSFLSYRWRLVGEKELDLEPENSLYQTAFIGSVLSGVEGASPIVRRVAGFVETQRDPGCVWRYMRKDHPGSVTLAPDVDDTALGSLLLREAGRPVGTADAVLLSNRDRQGRFYTWITVFGSWYRSAARVRILFDRLPRLRHVVAAFRGEYQRIGDVDAGVNANVVLYLGRGPSTEGAVNYLIDVAKRGVIDDRWYEDPFTLWFLISRALSRHGIQAGAVLLEQLGSLSPTTPLQLAEAVCIALDWGGHVPEEWIAGLLASQSRLGGWERIPLYSVRGKDDRWGGEATTSALCVQALSRWLTA
jgi:hypothetical protein